MNCDIGDLVNLEVVKALIIGLLMRKTAMLVIVRRDDTAMKSSSDHEIKEQRSKNKKE